MPNDPMMRFMGALFQDGDFHGATGTLCAHSPLQLRSSHPAALCGAEHWLEKTLGCQQSGIGQGATLSG
jgi:hypothetical protein